MPVLRPCLDCGTLTRQRGRCPSCARVADRARGTTAERGYDHRWKRASRQARSASPVCAECGATSDLTVDHVVPLAHGGSSHPSNMRVLCRSCNSGKGARMGGGGVARENVAHPKRPATPVEYPYNTGKGR